MSRQTGWWSYSESLSTTICVRLFHCAAPVIQYVCCSAALVSEVCRLYINEHLAVDNVCTIWADAEYFSCDSVAAQCAEFFSANPVDSAGVLDAEAFTLLPAKVVTAIACDEELNVSEVTLFNALVRWALAKYPQAADLSSEDRSALDALGLFAHVKYPLMTADEVADVVEPSSLVSIDFINEAYRWHATHRKGSDDNERFRPRKGVGAAFQSTFAASLSASASPLKLGGEEVQLLPSGQSTLSTWSPTSPSI